MDVDSELSRYANSYYSTCGCSMLMFDSVSIKLILIRATATQLECYISC